MESPDKPLETPSAVPTYSAERPEGAANSKRAMTRRQWYDRNKARAITQAKEYSQVHKERIAAQKKAWDARNREKKRAQMKAYYIKNKDRIKEYRERIKQENHNNLMQLRQLRNSSVSRSSSSSSSASIASNSDSEDVSKSGLSPPSALPKSPNSYLAMADLVVTVPAPAPQSMATGPFRTTSPMNIAALLNPET